MILSQIAVNAPQTAAKAEDEAKQDDSSLKGFFGLMRNNKDEKPSEEKLRFLKMLKLQKQIKMMIILKFHIFETLLY